MGVVQVPIDVVKSWNHGKAGIELADANVDTAPLVSMIDRVRFERGALARRLTDAGAFVPNGQANFVCARLPEAADVRSALAARGIAVRGYTGRPDLEEVLRITCPGDERAFGLLNAALDEVLPAGHPQA